MIGALELVRLARAPTAVQVLGAGIFLAELHFWPWWPRAVIVAPGFCIQGASYLYWRRSSAKVAFWIVVSIHALINCIPALSYIGSCDEAFVRLQLAARVEGGAFLLGRFRFYTPR